MATFDDMIAAVQDAAQSRYDASAANGAPVMIALGPAGETVPRWVDSVLNP